MTTPKRRPSQSVRVFLLAALVAPALPAQAWRAYADSAEKARVRADWPEYARLIDSVYVGLGNYPTVLWARARGAARLGQPDRALERLRIFAASGLTRDVAADSAFLPMMTDPALQRIKARIDANGATPARARVAHEIADSTFVPESIVYDETTKSFLVSSIKHGTIVQVSHDGRMEPIAKSTDGGVWAGFGLAFDPTRRTLWLASQQIPHFD
jgi:hypothetical protein